MTQKIGKEIRQAREAMQMSQEELAAKIPMTQSSLSRIERGLQDPSMHQIKRIAIVLNLSLDDLFELENVPSSKDLELLKDLKAFIKIHSV